MKAQLEQTRYERIAELAGDGCTAEMVAAYVEGEWDNQDEHYAWIVTATDEEIADWVAACRK